MVYSQNVANNSFERSLLELEEQFYRTFPAARAAMLERQAKLDQGLLDPTTELVYAYDPSFLDSTACGPSPSHDCSQDMGEVYVHPLKPASPPTSDPSVSHQASFGGYLTSAALHCQPAPASSLSSQTTMGFSGTYPPSSLAPVRLVWRSYNKRESLTTC